MLQDFGHPCWCGKGVGGPPPQEHLVHLLQRFPPIPTYSPYLISNVTVMLTALLQLLRVVLLQDLDHPCGQGKRIGGAPPDYPMVHLLQCLLSTTPQSPFLRANSCKNVRAFSWPEYVSFRLVTATDSIRYVASLPGTLRLHAHAPKIRNARARQQPREHCSPRQLLQQGPLTGADLRHVLSQALG